MPVTDRPRNVASTPSPTCDCRAGRHNRRDRCAVSAPGSFHPKWVESRSLVTVPARTCAADSVAHLAHVRRPGVGQQPVAPRSAQLANHLHVLRVEEPYVMIG